MVVEVREWGVESRVEGMGVQMCGGGADENGSAVAAAVRWMGCTRVDGSRQRRTTAPCGVMKSPAVS